jgi:hypothetical protein
MYRALVFSFLCLIVLSTALGGNQKEPTKNSSSAAAAQQTTTAPATTPEQKPFNLFTAYWWCALGILLSIMLPILRVVIPKPKPPSQTRGVAEQGSKLWEALRPYVVTAIFSLLTAILIVAFAAENLKTWNIAVLAGYAWDSTLQKLSIRS